MQKRAFSYLFLALVVVLAVSGIVSAVWWNPNNWNFGGGITGNAIASSDIRINVTYLGQIENRAGPWSFNGLFGNDFTFSLETNAPTGFTINRMRLVHTGFGSSEYWDSSTANAYPVVLYKGDVRQNSAYGSSVAVSSGVQNYRFYVQPAHTPFEGGTLTITLSDGTIINMNVPKTVGQSVVYGSYTGSSGSTTPPPTTTGTVQQILGIECIDSDGFNNFTVGNVTLKQIVLFTNGQSGYGPSSSFNDVCINSSNLREVTCASPTSAAPTFNTVACANGCANGACLSAPTSSFCTDTDGGINYTAKGSVSVNGVFKEWDFCGSGSLSNVAYDVHCLSSSNILGMGGRLGYNVSSTACTGSCNDGVCVPSSSLICTDTDGGINYGVAGSITYASVGGFASTLSDYCAPSNINAVVERYCDSGNSGTFDIYVCPNGCSNGACLSAPVVNLINISVRIYDNRTNLNFSGGVNLYPYGVNMYNSTFFRQCTGPVSSNFAGVYFNCINIPQGDYTLNAYANNYRNFTFFGRFLNTVQSNAALEPLPPPTCTSFTYSNWSTCSTSGQQTRTVVSSSPASCTGGSPILTQSCTYVPPTPTCTDSDGGLNYNMSGFVNTSGVIRYDTCINNSQPALNGNELAEYSCASDGNRAQSGYICPNGCSNGACLPSTTTGTTTGTTTTTIGANVAGCSDTDADAANPGGVNYGVRGTFNAPAESSWTAAQRTDYCVSSTKLAEYSCSPAPAGYDYNGVEVDCPNGCVDGRCLAQPTVIVPTSGTCGNGIVESGEGCDAGAQNGVSCTITGDSGTCTYCNSACQTESKSQSGSGGTTTPSASTCASGCSLQSGQCVPLGYRVSGKYCDVSKSLVSYKADSADCENNFECGSNVCVSNKCIEAGFLQKISDWFSKLFATSSAS